MHTQQQRQRTKQGANSPTSPSQLPAPQPPARAAARRGRTPHAVRPAAAARAAWPFMYIIWLMASAPASFSRTWRAMLFVVSTMLFSCASQPAAGQQQASSSGGSIDTAPRPAARKRPRASLLRDHPPNFVGSAGGQRVARPLHLPQHRPCLPQRAAREHKATRCRWEQQPRASTRPLTFFSRMADASSRDFPT